MHALHECQCRRSPAAFRTASSAAGIPAALSHITAMQSRFMFSCLGELLNVPGAWRSLCLAFKLEKAQLVISLSASCGWQQAEVNQQYQCLTMLAILQRQERLDGLKQISCPVGAIHLHAMSQPSRGSALVMQCWQPQS